MGTVSGGDIRQFKWGGRELEPAPEASFEITPNGFENDFKQTGNGKLSGTQKRVPASITGGKFIIRNSKGDLEYLQAGQAAGEPKPTNFTLADGTTWAGSMGINGPLKYTSSDGECGVEFTGETLEQI